MRSVPHPQASFIEYAQARRLDREAQEQALVDVVLRGPERSDDGRASVATSMLSNEMIRALTNPHEGR